MGQHVDIIVALKQHPVYRICREVADVHEHVYCVGGAVRDSLLGKTHEDLDVLVLSSHPEEYKQRLLETLEKNGWKWIQLHKMFGLFRVFLHSSVTDIHITCSPLYENLRNRDFTINAIALELNESGDIIIHDPFGGQHDLRRRILRACYADVFREDPVRILRMYRFHARSFRIDPVTLRYARSAYPLLSSVPVERVQRELLLLFREQGFAEIFRTMAHEELFFILFPPLRDTKGCEQGRYHHVDVWEHTCLVVEHMLEVLASYESVYSQDIRVWFMEEEFTMMTPRYVFLILSALLHDIGKPSTRKSHPRGGYAFHQHDVVGARIVSELLEVQKWSKKASQYIVTCVREHLKPLIFAKRFPSKRAGLALVRLYGRNALPLAILSFADQKAKQGPLMRVEQVRLVHEVLDSVLHFIEHETDEVVRFPLSGDDLIEVFGLQPGPHIGKILQKIRKEWAVGYVHTRDECLRRARELVHSGYISQFIPGHE